MSTRPGDSRAARATLTYLAEPADPLLRSLLREADPCEIVAAIRTCTVPDAMSRQLNPAQQARIRTRSGAMAGEASRHPGGDRARLP